MSKVKKSEVWLASNINKHSALLRLVRVQILASFGHGSIAIFDHFNSLNLGMGLRLLGPFGLQFGSAL